MIEEDAKKAQLLAALTDVEEVKAAAIVREDGTLERGRGRARALRYATEPADGGGEVSEDPEDVYLKSLGDAYLVVVFAARTDFDLIEREVERLLGELEMA